MKFKKPNPISVELFFWFYPTLEEVIAEKSVIVIEINKNFLIA